MTAFAPVLWAHFGGWDDPMHLTANPDFNPPTVAGVLRYWFAPAFSMYAPAAYTLWGAIAAIAYHDGQLHPLPFHAANLLLHILMALASFDLLRKLSGSIPAALLGACVIALHPLQVEPVAWVSGLRDVLMGMLALAALRFYFLSSSRRGYLLATIFFFFATLSKPTAIVVPAIAFILDTAVLRRSPMDSLRRLWPWIIFCLAIAWITHRAQPASFMDISLRDRPLVAMDAIGFYLWKIFWPLKLGIDYGRTPQSVIAAHSLLWMLPLLAAVIVIIAWIRGNRRPAIGLTILVLALLPVLGLIPFEFQAYSTVADRYIYLAMLGPAIAIAGIFSQKRAPWIWIIAILACAIAIILSFRQSRTWHDGMTLSNQALIANPRSWASQGYIAALDLEANQPHEAIAHAQLAVQMNPNYAKALDTLGQAYAKINQSDQAAAAYRHAVEISPNDLTARLGLAGSLADAGQYPQAIEQYRSALQIEPRNVVTLSNLAATYGEMGQFEQAIRFYDVALSIDPSFTPAQIGRQHAVQAMQTKPR
jgi:tetratricopeptide (TPR) repeat protein